MDLKEVRYKEQSDTLRHPWEQARVQVIHQLLTDHYKGNIPSGLTILDVGCGDTYVAEALYDRFQESSIYAIDIAFSEEQLAALKGHLSNKRIYPFASQEAATANMNKAVDIVLLLDVVEHIEQDIAFLTDLSNKKGITKDTLFLITVPAYQSLFNSHDVFMEHYRRYTNTTLLQTMEQSGLKSLNMGYFFFSLLPPRIAQKTLESLLNKKADPGKTGLTTWNKGKFITALVTGTLTADFYLSRFLRMLGIKVPGLSNFVLCRKAA